MTQNTEKKKNPMGRPKKELDWDVVNKFLAMGLQKKHILFFFGVSEDVLDYRLREHFDMTFTEYRKNQISNGDILLMNHGWNRAFKNDGILKLFLQNRFNLKDKVESNVQVDVDPEIVKKMAEEYLKSKSDE